MTIHGTDSFVTDNGVVALLNSAMNWIAGQKSTLNTKYVGLLGNLTMSSVTSYVDYITNQGHTYDEFVDYCNSESDWQNQFKRVKNSASVIRDAAILIGVAFSQKDYPGNGLDGKTVGTIWLSQINMNINTQSCMEMYDGENYYRGTMS